MRYALSCARGSKGWRRVRGASKAALQQRRPLPVGRECVEREPGRPRRSVEDRGAFSASGRLPARYYFHDFNFIETITRRPASVGHLVKPRFHFLLSQRSPRSEGGAHFATSVASRNSERASPQRSGQTPLGSQCTPIFAPCVAGTPWLCPIWPLR